jgi:hypothetical protein
VRVKALAAHAEAALKIEHDNNVGRGLSQFELDLHGLHATEAVEALDRRLVLFFCACPRLHLASTLLCIICIWITWPLS